MIVLEKRASTVLYNYLMTRADDRTYLVPSHACALVPLTFLAAGKKFEFVDIADGSLCMDEGIVLERLRERPGVYGGVLFIHTYGVEHSGDRFFRAVKETDDTVSIIDDRCLCAPDLSGVLPPDADLVMYSTGYGKQCDIGFGGYGVLRAGERYVRHDTAFRAEDLAGLNEWSRRAVDERHPVRACPLAWLDTGAVGIGWEDYCRRVTGQLRVAVPHRDAINTIYAAGIPAALQFEGRFQNWRFSIRVPRKEVLLRDIFGAGLFASSHYASLDGVFSAGRSPRAELLHRDVVNLFNDMHFDEARAGRVVEIVGRHAASYGCV